MKAETEVHKYLGSVVMIFYGLAIASGVEAVAPKIIKHISADGSLTLAFFSLLALVVAVSDWAVYYDCNADAPYRGPGRFLFDLLFPVLIFFLFQTVEMPRGFLGLLCLYFGLSVLYLIVLRSESRRLRPGLLICSLCCLILSGLATFLITMIDPEIPALPIAICLAIGIPWATCTMSRVRRRIQAEGAESVHA